MSQTIFHKKYVDVLEIRRKDGTLEPKEIIFDNKRYKIEWYEYKQYGASRTGSSGKHYTIWIAGHKHEMYMEKDKWFIETGFTAPEERTYELTDEELSQI